MNIKFMEEGEEGSKQSKASDPSPIFRDILSTLRIRCSFLWANGMDRFLLGYHRSFLWYFSIVLYALFLLA